MFFGCRASGEKNDSKSDNNSIFAVIVPQALGAFKAVRPLFVPNSMNPHETIHRAIPHHAARADSEEIQVLIKAFFRRNTLCIAKDDNEAKCPAGMAQFWPGKNEPFYCILV